MNQKVEKTKIFQGKRRRYIQSLTYPYEVIKGGLCIDTTHTSVASSQVTAVETRWCGWKQLFDRNEKNNMKSCNLKTRSCFQLYSPSIHLLFPIERGVVSVHFSKWLSGCNDTHPYQIHLGSFEKGSPCLHHETKLPAHLFKVFSSLKCFKACIPWNKPALPLLFRVFSKVHSLL